MARRAGLLAVLLLVAGMAIPDGAAAAEVVEGQSSIVRDGNARFEVVTPSLIRLEYARDGRFENRPTMTAVRAGRPVPRYSTYVRDGWRVIRTDRVTLRWRRGSGSFDAADLRLTFRDRGRTRTVRPEAGAAHRYLGGWTRALDVQTDRVPLHPGVLTREGWYVLDDSKTALLTSTRAGFAVRPQRQGRYQDWYLFGYGHDYARALRDLHALTGRTPLLPRSAFGVWFSKYYAYTEEELRALVARFRSERVPLDTISLDTDYKSINNPIGAAIAAAAAGSPGKAFSWNGWDWNRSLFGDPAGFLDWAHDHGLNVVANIHPSINSNDPRYAATVAKAGPLRNDGACLVMQADPLGTCRSFDWTKPAQLAAYFDLHRPFARDGIDMFWLDWCCEGEGAVTAPGLAGDTWINSRYARFQRNRGERWPAFSRIGAAFASDGVDGDRDAGADGTGAFAEHRYSVQFTGDTCATWPMLAFEAEMTAAEAAIGLPYVSHDIGSFNGVPVGGQCQGVTGALSGAKVPDDLYARWLQFGTFQPLDRLHSNHGDRLPWEYGPAADAAATAALRLRGALVPYTYTAARHAVDTGLPMAGPLYLRWPGHAGAYKHPSEFTYGPDLLVAPVTTAGDPAPATVWIPPGEWIDWFTGRHFRGPAVRTFSVPLSRLPVLVRAGAIIPTQVARAFSGNEPAARLILDVFAGSRGRYELYDDAGTGFGYQRGAFTRTVITQRRTAGGVTLVIGPARGGFDGERARRRWRVRIHQLAAPSEVRIDGRVVSWEYDTVTHRLTVPVTASTSRSVVLRVLR